LQQVLHEIETQSKYVFLFDENELPVLPITVDLKNVSIEEALSACLTNLPLTYKIVDKNILLKAKEQSLLDRIRKVFETKLSLIVTVTDEKGNPLQGATVKILQNGPILITNVNGFVQLKDVSENALIEISFIGYETVRLKVTADLKIVEMKPSMASLSEVVINKGYYTTTERLNTGSAVQINAADLERQPLTNPIQALQGLVPGLYVKQSSGVAASTSSVLIRGRNSINSGNQPLYIVDGVPYNGTATDQQIGGFITSGQPNGTTDPLNNINPTDIESITVLKDADATAIYGSRGSNGVILITTKRAVKGKPALNFNVSSGIGEVVKQRALLSSSDYLALRRQGFANDNVTPTAALAPDLMVWDQNANTNYQNMLIGNTAKITDASTSLSMGTDKSSILLSGNYHNEQSVLYGGYGYIRGGFNMGAQHTSGDNRLKLSLGANLTFGSNNMPGADYTSAAISMPANYPLYDAAGKLYWVTDFNNPIATSRQTFDMGTSNMVFSANLSYLIVKGLTFRTNAGYDIVSQTYRNTVPASTFNPIYSLPSQGIYTSSNGKTLIAEPQLNYETPIWKGKLSTTIGGSYQHNMFAMPYYIQASTFASESLLDNLGNAASFPTVSSLSQEYKYISTYGLVNYNIADKYLFNGTFRRDGSSRFGPDKKFGNFGSVAAAWLFSEEQFIKDINLFSFGKLRSSYGITGNDQVGNYGYLDTYTSTSTSYGGNPGFYPTRIANPNYRWETNRKFEVALDLGFLDDRIRLTSAFYLNRSGNMVVNSSPLPAQSGFPSFTENLDMKVQNKGWEFNLHTVPVKSKVFRWDLSANFTRARNKILSIPAQVATLYANTYQVGQSVSSFIGYQNTGFVDGVAQFADRNGDGAVTSGLANDTYIIASRDPKFYGGITSGLSYKRFRLDFLINFVKQKGIAQTAFPGLLGSQLDDLLQSPFKPSASTSSAAYNSYTRYISSDAVIVDASFMRLRNLSLSYSFPRQWLDAVKVKNGQIFLRGENLVTVTNYKGLDPETQGSVLPPLKMFTAGLQFSF
jgi:TonB-linked SusC/RagA family outer membrane protein